MQMSLDMSGAVMLLAATPSYIQTRQASATWSSIKFSLECPKGLPFISCTERHHMNFPGTLVTAQGYQIIVFSQIKVT